MNSNASSPALAVRAHHSFWHRGEIVATVAGPASLTEQQARSLALESHDRVPLCDRPSETPIVRRRRILDAERRVYPLGS